MILNYMTVCGLIGTIFLRQTIADTRDVVFVLDRSGSIYYQDFYDAIDFVYNVTKWLTIGPSTDHLQVSIVTFSTNVEEVFDLNDYTTKTDLLTAIEAVKSNTPSGGTNTHDALQFCSTSSFNQSHGARNNVSRAVVVLTDGLSTQPYETSRQAASLQNAGIEIYAIGVGSTVASSMSELQAIASDPDSYYLNTVGTYSNLCLLVPELVPKLDSSVANLADTCGVSNSTSEEALSETTDLVPILASVAAVAAVAGIVATALGVAKLLSTMKAGSSLQGILGPVSMYGKAPLGPGKPKFTTKFVESGIPFGNIIPSQAPAQTFSPRSIASIIVLD